MTLGSTEPYIPTEEDVIPEPLVPKFALGQLVFFMCENRIHSAKVQSRKVVENAHDGWASTEEQKGEWQPFGKSGIRYRTVGQTHIELDLFASREELLEAL